MFLQKKLADMDDKIAKNAIGIEGEHLATVSRAFVDDWLRSLRTHCSARQYADFLARAGFGADGAGAGGRVTHDQIVRLYQEVAVGTGDEMVGLWSRPIRSGALKALCSAVIDAPSMRTALWRFTRFWNLLLDDFSLGMEEMPDGSVRIALEPRGEGGNGQVPHRFGHMLLLKLTHGIASWLAGREVPLAQVGFAFPRPPFAEDYPILFPAAIGFGEPRSFIRFAPQALGLPVGRRAPEMREFLVRAPRDWIFTSSREHALQLKVRELLHAASGMDCRLDEAARALHMSPRTLMRQLAAQGLSFQGIKDGLRRDVAIRDLRHSDKSIEAISEAVGFSSASVFHRAFRQWTGMTPASYRRKLVRLPPPIQPAP